MQAIQRGKAARQHAAEQQAAAVKVQSLHRGRRGRDRAKRQRMQTDQAPQEAAAAGSENLEQGGAPTDMDEELGAATRIQAAHRGKKGRQQLAAQHAAATKVQSVHRGRAGRGKARRRATTTEEKDAAVAAFVGAESEAEAAAPTPPVSAKPSMDAMVAAIFNHYDSDGDGYLRQQDVSRLEHETGEGGTVDDAAWEALCEMLEADKNVVSVPCSKHLLCTLTPAVRICTGAVVGRPHALLRDGHGRSGKQNVSHQASPPRHSAPLF